MGIDISMTKLDKLCNWEGVSLEEFIEQFCHDSLVPAICMNKGCDYVEEMEINQTEGWCPECKSNTMVAGSELIFDRQVFKRIVEERESKHNNRGSAKDANGEEVIRVRLK